MAKQQYNDDAVRAILKRAVDFQENEVDITRQQLFDIGLEAGLTEEAIVKAEREWLAGQSTTTSHNAPLIAQFEQERRTEYARHVLLYLIAIAILFGINLVMGLSFPWFLFPFLGAGAGIAVRGE